MPKFVDLSDTTGPRALEPAAPSNGSGAVSNVPSPEQPSMELAACGFVCRIGSTASTDDFSGEAAWSSNKTTPTLPYKPTAFTAGFKADDEERQMGVVIGIPGRESPAMAGRPVLQSRGDRVVVFGVVVARRPGRRPIEHQRGRGGPVRTPVTHPGRSRIVERCLARRIAYPLGNLRIDTAQHPPLY